LGFAFGLPLLFQLVTNTHTTYTRTHTHTLTHTHTHTHIHTDAPQPFVASTENTQRRTHAQTHIRRLTFVCSYMHYNIGALVGAGAGCE
jgi:carbohydrate-binding DOMON domain-containing protein